jgi:hypothetical protein|nr:MAG TPA: hypothetical protein [Caudoviricetes sp.]
MKFHQNRITAVGVSLRGLDMNNNVFSQELTDVIFKILKNGDSVELKKENGKLVVVQIQRKVKNKTLING